MARVAATQRRTLDAALLPSCHITEKAMPDDATTRPGKHNARIRVGNNGPYWVSGGPMLTTRTSILNAEGEPTDWASGADRPTRASYVLCRCGHSGNKPFCDGTHAKIGFDGRCTAERAPGAQES